MSIDIVSITKKNSNYTDQKELQSLEYYLDLTRKIINYFADRLQPGLSKRLLSDQDAIANIAYKLMDGDCNWNPDYNNEAGKKRTRRAYLNQCGVWAIMEYIRRQQNQKLDTISITREDYDIDIPCNKYNPEHILAREEEKDAAIDKVNQIIASSGLKPMEEACVRGYTLCEDFKQVSEELGISSQYARVLYNQALTKIKEVHT